MKDFNSDNKTIVELSTDYMKAYFLERDVSGEDSIKAQNYKACWDLFNGLAKNLRDSKNLEVQKEKHRSLTERCSYFIVLFLKKLLK